MNATPQMAKQKLAKDLRTTIDDVEELLRLTAGQVGERMGEVRNRLQSSLTESKAHLTHLQTEARSSAESRPPLRPKNMSTITRGKWSALSAWWAC